MDFTTKPPTLVLLMAKKCLSCLMLGLFRRVDILLLDGVKRQLGLPDER
jgi:hypothetical protein